MSVDFLLVQRAIRAWVTAGSGLPIDSVYWGQQDSKRVAEPAIEMRILASHTLGQAWEDTENNPLVRDPLVISSVTLAGNVLTAVGHGLGTGDGPFQLTTSLTLPGGLSPLTNYWVIRLTPDTFQLARSYISTGGVDIDGLPSGSTVTPLTLQNQGTGVLTVSVTAETLRAGQELRSLSRAIELLTVTLECHTTSAVGMESAVARLSRIKSRQQLPSQGDILASAHLGLIDVQRVRAIHGTRNAIMFEPRAIMEVLFSMPTEEYEYSQSIERVIARNVTTGATLLLD